VDMGVGFLLDRYALRLDGRNLADARDPIAESEWATPVRVSSRP
jgi:hypothetical protein